MLPPSLPAILIRRICTLSAATLATFTAAETAVFTAFAGAVFLAATFAATAEAAVLMTGGGSPVAIFPAIFSPEMASCDQPVFRTRILYKRTWIPSKVRVRIQAVILWKQIIISNVPDRDP
jgi:hypothetical protein